MRSVRELCAYKSILVSGVYVGLFVVEEDYGMLAFSVVEVQKALESFSARFFGESVVLRGCMESMKVFEQPWVLVFQIVEYNAANVAKEVQNTAGTRNFLQKRFHALHGHLCIRCIDSTTLYAF